MSTSRRWCFTVNNPTDEDMALLSAMGESEEVVYCVMGDEVGESGTPHVQGFVIFQRNKRLSGVKKVHSTAHWEIARGTSEEAANYCKKDGKFVEYGECPSDTRITSEDNIAVWEHARDMARQGRFDEIRADIYMRCRQACHAIYEDACAAKECIPVLDHIWITGATGCGKSRYCWETFPGAYRKPLSKWWDHYTNEKVVIIEDVDPSHGQWMGNFLKLWSDHYPFIAERKGGSRMIRPEKIVVTSNYLIGDVFKDPGLHLPLMRRFSTKSVENGNLVNYIGVQEGGFFSEFRRVGRDHYAQI